MPKMSQQEKNRLSPPVRFRSVNIDSLVRQWDPTPRKDVIYRFSNGRVFTQDTRKNPYV